MRDSCELTVAARGERDAQRSGRIWLNCAKPATHLQGRTPRPSPDPMSGSARGIRPLTRPILSRRATDPGSVGCRRRGPACPRRAELQAHLQRRLHGLARGAEAPRPRRLRDVPQPDHKVAFGDAGAAGGYHKAIDIPQNDATGRHPVFAIEGGTVEEAKLAWISPRSTNAFAAERSASPTSATRTSCRASRSGRRSRRGRRSARRARVGGTCTSRSMRPWVGRASRSTRFGPAGSSPP